MIAIDGVGVRYGGVVALNDVSATFTAPVGGIIGPNGAGKTTLMNVISGFVARPSGRVLMDGRDLLDAAAAQALATGPAPLLPKGADRRRPDGVRQRAGAA